MELFTHELTGDLKAEALNLRALRKLTHEKNAPIQEQVQELARQAKALMKQIETNEEAFDQARESFFTKVGDELARDIDRCHLRIEDETGKVFVERTEEDLERGGDLKQALGQLLKALASGEASVEVRELDEPEEEGCGDPACQGCNPTIH